MIPIAVAMATIEITTVRIFRFFMLHYRVIINHIPFQYDMISASKLKSGAKTMIITFESSLYIRFNQLLTYINKSWLNL